MLGFEPQSLYIICNILRNLDKLTEIDNSFCIEGIKWLILSNKIKNKLWFIPKKRLRTSGCLSQKKKKFLKKSESTVHIIKRKKKKKE